MAISLDNLTKLRPYIFHLTSRSNLYQLRNARTLDPAWTLVQEAGRQDLARRRRRTSIELNGANSFVHIRDQAPLHRGFIQFSSRGKRSPRGPGIYRAADAFPGTASDVKEVVFGDSVTLPNRVEVGNAPNGPWYGLDDAA